MPTQQTASGSVTFRVDDVAPASKPLAEAKAYEALREALGGPVESCSDYHTDVVRGRDCHGLLTAVYGAFKDHRPLVLSPDHVWLTIAQGVAHHMLVEGERLRGRFVSHEGRVVLEYVTTEFVRGTPENPWDKAFAGWGDKIRQHVGGDLHDLLRCDFSTTGPVERAASDVVMMDVFERYFHYALYCVCGIPTVTLEGSAADWERLLAKARGLAVFDCDWWLRELLPICEQFVRAARGDVDVEHWRGICKLRSEYGGDLVNGWVAKLFPYLRSYIKGPCKRRNPIFETGEGFQTMFAPSGLSRVPFTWRELGRGDRPMEAVAGFLGVTQDRANLALRPMVGWAVREQTGMEPLIARLRRDHETRPGQDRGAPRG